MGKQITIAIQGKSFSAELNDTPAAQTLARALPLTMSMSRWGEEYYGDCGLSLKAEAGARELLEVGELAYWPPGKALCIFFGPTPASSDERPRAVSPVVPLGRITSSLAALKSCGVRVTAELA